MVLVLAFALPACEPTEESGWYTPEGDYISFDLTTIPGWLSDVGLMVTSDLQDLGLDVTHQVIDSTTFVDYLYQPNLGAMQVFIYREDPAVDPWSDWIWSLMSDPYFWGYLWNNTWYDNERFNELSIANILAANQTDKKDILFEMQEILAEDLPLIYLVRPELISSYRTDNWEDWYNTLGGPVIWNNEYSYREVTPVGNATQLNVGSQVLMPNLMMDTEAMTYTNIGCLYYMMVYECWAFIPKINEDPGASYDFVPKLIQDYEVSYEDDGEGGQNQIWTLHLQEGVKWHDYDTSGKNVTADDLVFSMKHVVGKWSVGKPINWTAVEEDTGWEEIWPEHVLVGAEGDYTAKMTYIDGWHIPEDYVQNWWLWDPIVPKHIFEPPMLLDPEDPDYKEPWEWDGNRIGTGPFKVKEFEADDYLLLERFDDYWGDLPAAETVLYKLYEGIGPMFTALEAGVIDVVENQSVPFSKIPDYEADPNITVEPVPGLSIYYMGFNLHPDEGYDVLKDKILRQAVAYAIDKQDILDMVFGGYGEIPDGFIYLDSIMHNPDLPQYEFNPTTARDMLLAAGYTYVE